MVWGIYSCHVNLQYIKFLEHLAQWFSRNFNFIKNHIIAISNNITDIVISVSYVVGLRESTTKKICKSISQFSTKLWPKRGFCILIGSVSHLESDLNQNLISSFPWTRVHCCKSKCWVNCKLFQVNHREGQLLICKLAGEAGGPFPASHLTGLSVGS